MGNNQPFYNTCLFYHGTKEKNIGILPNKSHFSCTLFTESLQLPRQAWNQPGSGATGREGRKRKNQIPKWVPGFWQRMRDSNPRKRSQSPVCYRYTNPLYSCGNAPIISNLSEKSRKIFRVPGKFFTGGIWERKHPVSQFFRRESFPSVMEPGSGLRRGILPIFPVSSAFKRFLRKQPLLS